MFNKKNLTALSGALLVLTAAPSVVTAKSFEANLNNNYAQVELETNIHSTSNLYVNASLLYGNETGKKSAVIGTIGIQGIETDNETYRAAVGGRLYFYDHGAINGSAIAVGGMFYHTVPGAKRLSAGGYGWIAPKVISFGDTQQVFELGARVAFRVIQNGDVFVGYRYLSVKNEKAGKTHFNDPLEKGVNVGFRLNF